MTQLALDEAWSKTPPGQLGTYTGAFVYISHDMSKCATDTYIAALHAAGKGVGFVFEDAATRWRGGQPAGVADGQYANAWADAHGVPVTVPLYAAVDSDVVTDADFAVAIAYVEGFASVKREGRGYGEWALIEKLAAAGIGNGWQACAWSGTKVSSHAAVYQRLTHTAPTVPGSYDEDVLLDPADAGLWYATPVPPPPAPLPAPAPPPVLSGPHRKADMAPHVLLLHRSTGEWYTATELLDEKRHIGLPETLGILQADPDYETKDLPDAEIDAIPQVP